jgi:FkbM family methyltransferase
MPKPSLPARIGSRIVRSYLHASPIERGKTRLRRAAAPFLVTRLDTGPWVRVSGAAEFEWRVFDGRVKEDRTTRLFATLLRPGMTVLDVGANVGYYALTAAALVGPAGRVHAFEPTPAVAARLRENVALNDFDHVAVNQVAVTDAPGTLRFHLSADDSEANSLCAVEPGGATIDVPATTLDDYAAGHGLGRVDFVKIDVEGAEVRALRGGRRLLSGPEAPMVIIEVNPVTLRAAGAGPEELVAELESLGYACETIERMPWCGEVVSNVFACKPMHRDRVPGLSGMALDPVAV